MSLSVALCLVAFLLSSFIVLVMHSRPPSGEVILEPFERHVLVALDVQIANPHINEKIASIFLDTVKQFLANWFVAKNNAAHIVARLNNCFSRFSRDQSFKDFVNFRRAIGVGFALIGSANGVDNKCRSLACIGYRQHAVNGPPRNQKQFLFCGHAEPRPLFKSHFVDDLLCLRLLLDHDFVLVVHDPALVGKYSRLPSHDAHLANCDDDKQRVEPDQPNVAVVKGRPLGIFYAAFIPVIPVSYLGILLIDRGRRLFGIAIIVCALIGFVGVQILFVLRECPDTWNWWL